MEKRLRQTLAKRIKRHIRSPKRARSAVLVPLFWLGDQCHILFIRRTQDVKHHKGQIAFPGGAYQPEDGKILNTALRECTEEIGLKRKDAKILGELDDFITTTSNFVISPFVARIPYPYPFQLNHLEIDELIAVPLSALCDKKNVHLEEEIIDGKKVATINYHYLGNVIWGATARILTQLLELIQASDQR